MIAIYCIFNKINGKRYIGKTINTNQRWATHRWAMRSKDDIKGANRHLVCSARKYGVDCFDFMVLESFDVVDEQLIAERELFWMDHYQSTDRSKGYNLRRDSSSGMVVHDETKELLRESMTGELNPNYGNNWGEEQKSKMSSIVKDRHSSGKYYGDEWKKKIGAASAKMWKDEDKKKRMAASVSKAKMKYDFEQYTRSGEFIRTWASVAEIVEHNPNYKWQNIYSVCNGYKKTYQGYIWKKKEKNNA